MSCTTLATIPMELTNQYPTTQICLVQQEEMARLLAEQRTQKRLTPMSGVVPGQDCNPWEECAAVCSDQ